MEHSCSLLLLCVSVLFAQALPPNGTELPKPTTSKDVPEFAGMGVGVERDFCCGPPADIVRDIFQDFDPTGVLLVLSGDLCIPSPCDWCCALYFLLLVWEMHRIAFGEVEKLGTSPPA